MKRLVITALAALLLVGGPIAAYAQAESGAAAEQPAGKKHKSKKGKKGKKKSKEQAPAGESK
ncbi:MAG TPA: hypothetical protein VMW17_08715 [Candidatus Binatia bacterium]|nr:hypothetical protein [Candidatus Binatia bacterium]